MLGYSSSLLPLESDNSIAVRRLLSDPPQRHLTICGCVGSAKTFSILAWIHMICVTQPNVRVAICRQERVTLYTTLVESFRKILAAGMQNADDLPYMVRGGAHRPDSIHYASGSSITFLGYDSSKLFGSEWSIIWTNEARLVDEEAYAEVSSRLRAGGFYDRYGRETYLKLCDTNADHDQHWIKAWEYDKRLKLVNMKIEDNPYYFTSGEYTPEGEMYISDLRVNFVGWAYKRFVENIWCQAEGAVYAGVYDEDLHVIDKKIPNDWWYSVSIDHSHAGTIALVLWANSPDNLQTHAFKCIYTTDKTIDIVFDEFERLLAVLGITKQQIRIVIADHDLSKNVEIERRGYVVENATKRVVGGIELAKTWIARGSVTFAPNMLAHAPDPKLKFKGKCDRPLQEFGRYVYPVPCLDDKPLKGHDDFLDSMRYHLEYFASLPQLAYVPVGIGEKPVKLKEIPDVFG